MNRIEASDSNNAETIRTPSVRDTAGGSKNRTKLEAVKAHFKKAAAAVTRDAGPSPKTKTRGRGGRGRVGGSEGRGLFLRTMPRQERGHRAQRYGTLRQASGARTSVAVSFLAAAAEMMKDMREALERVFGPPLTPEEIERRREERREEAQARIALEEIELLQKWLEEQRRREQERIETRAGAGGSIFMSETLDRMHLWQQDYAVGGGCPDAAIPAASNSLSL